MERRRVWGVLAVVLLGLFLGYRTCRRQPVQVGFAGQLTGKQAELGRQERDGALLATEIFNGRGGVNGRPVSLLIRDDAGIPEQAAQADQDLIRHGVVGIIGHSTTAQTLAGLRVTTPAGVVMVGPTISTPRLSGLDDLFFRVYPSFQDSARNFAARIAGEGAPLGVVWDSDNGAYTDVYASTFVEEYRKHRREPVAVAAFSSQSHRDFGPLLEGLRSKGVRRLLIVASDVDTAMMAQKVRLMGWDAALYTSAWAQTMTLIEQGGRAVEGMQLEQSFSPDSSFPEFLEFRSAFEGRFGRPPSFGAVFAYEATMVLLEALKRTDGRSAGLKSSLLATRNFQGLTGLISLDRYGDVVRPFYLSEIRGGRFVTRGILDGPRAPGGED